MRVTPDITDKKQYIITLDGVIQYHVLLADDETGEIERCAVDKNGSIFLDKQSVIVNKYVGKVVIVTCYKETSNEM